MSEINRTLTYLGVTAVIVVIAVATLPRTSQDHLHERAGKPLFDKLTDPLVVKSLEIVEYDDESKQVNQFSVAEKGGRWVIPSNDDYPADAKDKVANAAAALVGLPVIKVVSEVTSDHVGYGVVQPDAETTAAQEGVGKRLVFKDKQGKTVADLIIGKEVADNEGQRFVRIAGQTPMYTAEINPDDFSTTFEDWIEKDLLELDAFDVNQLVLKDYSIGIELVGNQFVRSLDERLAMTVSYNDTDMKWELDDLQEGREGRLQPSELLSGEELDKERLDNLKSALADLEIADVERKPEGLTADLKADEGFLKNEEAMMSLASRGFIPVPQTGDVLCREGEIIARTKDAVEYVLRFGATPDDQPLHRYLFVTARVNEADLPVPEQEPLPELPEGAEEPAEDATPPADGDQPAPASEGGETPPAETPAPETPAPETPTPETPEAAPAADPPTTTDSNAGTNQDAQPAGDAGEPPATADAPEQPPAGGDAAEQPPAEGDTPPEGADAPVEKTEAELKAEIIAERERIQKENQRKLDEYNEKRNKAEKKVRELNFRFAEWYYLISEETYKKIHLGRADVVKESETAKEEGTDVDAFRKLEEDGLTKEETDAADDAHDHVHE